MRFLAKKIAAMITLLSLSLFNVAYALEYNMTRGVTKLSQEVHDLHMTIFYVCCVIGVVVFGVMFYALFKHRKSKGAVPAHFHEHIGIEILWTIIPFVILVAMAIPATRVLKDMYNTEDSQLTIEVIGHQWRWQYKYLDHEIDFFSSLTTSNDAISNLIPKGEHYLREVDNPLVLPTNTKIRFLFTSQDVQHAWWVPDLGFKRDTIPGFVNENWAIIKETGTFRGQCAELCGVLHGFMPIVVIAKTPEEFEKWVAEKTAAQKASAQPAPAAPAPAAKPAAAPATTQQTPAAAPAATAPATTEQKPAAAQPSTSH
jgi:cytochrome c oxidase subunit 2